MISICIPVYNVLISSLIHELVHQCRSLSLKFEILVYDDGSDISYKKENQTISNINEVVYKELPVNKGCAGIRNKMAEEAIFPNLLFIDSDSEFDQEYIARYIPFLSQDYSVVCGGRIHPIQLPDLSKSLRWTVGKKKEDFPSLIRQKVPNKSFMSNNFLIQKKIFNIVSFDESIPKSGHEDTLFGINLEIKGIKIHHIDNPVVHIGLENNEEFIRKTKQRLETLYILEKRNEDNPLFYERIRILKVYKQLHAAHLSGVLKRFYKISNLTLEKKLTKPNPSLILYDLYKLGYYATLAS